jgi:hypothetical protein
LAADPARRPTAPQPHSSPIRVEYLDYASAPDHREYRLALHAPEGARDVRYRIAIAAFAANRVLLQDGPDVCYQRLLRTLSAGETPSPDVVTIEDADLAAYREAHTPVRRRSATPRTPSRPPSPPRPRPAESRAKLPVAAPAPAAEPEPTFDAGQRVSHAVYGIGVTQASSGERTSVHFDEHGLRTFVTSLLELEALSAPHEWETGPRGKNRPRDPRPPER